MNETQKYLEGKGLDTSIRKNSKLKNATYIKKPYDNTYRLHPDVDFESLDFVYNKDSVNTTKFSIILLTEWIRYIKKGGFLVVEFEENSLLNKRRLHKIYNKYLSRFSKIVFEEKQGKTVKIVFQKIKSQLVKGDSIDKWTFGVITLGKRNEWVRQFIQSVREQNVPQYEIIIVGTWNDTELKDKHDIKYIHFTQKDDKGWITKKKNIAFKKAKYNNVLILHDRFFLGKDWFSGMKKYGNSWDAIFFPIIDKKGFEYVHWSVWGKGLMPIGYADIKDWGEDYYAGGTFMAVKRDIFNRVPLDENRFWAEQEDGEHGLRFTKNGYIIRANPYSKLHTTVTYIYDAPVYKFDNKKYGKTIEHRGKKWLYIQPIVDMLTRTFDLPFLRYRRKFSLMLKKYISKVNAPEAGGKRD